MVQQHGKRKDIYCNRLLTNRTHIKQRKMKAYLVNTGQYTFVVAHYSEMGAIELIMKKFHIPAGVTASTSPLLIVHSTVSEPTILI